MNTLPAGMYIISDPCYIIAASNNEWGNLLERHDCFTCGGVFEENGVKFGVFHTAHGDGRYYDNFGREYSVDSGLIGVIPKSMVEKFDWVGDVLHEVGFKNDFAISYDDGKIIFGNIIIETDPGWEDESEHDE